MEPRHLGYIRITGELVQHMFLTSSPDNHWYRVQNGIPDDAKFIRMSIDESQGRCDLLLVYEHPSFPKYIAGPGWAMHEIQSPMFEAAHVSKEEIEEIHRRKLTEAGLFLAKSYAEFASDMKASDPNLKFEWYDAAVTPLSVKAE